jgi:hypothetical protein
MGAVVGLDKYSKAVNEPKKILIWPALVPGFVKPVRS